MKTTLLAKALNVFMIGTFYANQKAKHTLSKLQKVRNGVFEIINAPIKLGSVQLKNRIIMSTMTRCSAVGNQPNEIMTEYYKQRSGAGLIITEGTSPSPNGLGYPRIPGIFNKRQIEAWGNTTSAVHKSDGKIFVKLMHTGRISHPLNMPKGAEILAPSALRASGKMWTENKKMQDFPIPKEMSFEDMWRAKIEFVTAARNAIKAGFDGVELNAGNGYLLEQFLSPLSNIRKDNYGGGIENRCRFVIEVLTNISDAIGKGKTGIRLSPYGIAGDMQLYPEINSTYNYLSEEINKIGPSYIHLADHSTVGAPVIPLELMKNIRNNFKNTIILSGGYDIERAENDIKSGLADLIAFGRPFINNPNQVEKLKNNWPLSQDLKINLFYTAEKTKYAEFPIGTS